MQTVEIPQKDLPFESYQLHQGRYTDRAEENTSYLEAVAEKLLSNAVNLAANNAWASWDEEQPEGTEVELDPATLLYCPDEKVRRIMLIWQQIMDFLWDEEVGSNP